MSCSRIRVFGVFIGLLICLGTSSCLIFGLLFNSYLNYKFQHDQDGAVFGRFVVGFLYLTGR